MGILGHVLDILPSPQLVHSNTDKKNAYDLPATALWIIQYWL